VSDHTLAPPSVAPVPAAPGRPWWRDAVIYQVYVRSFAAGPSAPGSPGPSGSLGSLGLTGATGVGNLAGVRSRLPYLADLGVDAIWFNPWYPSPMADAGYDVADYRAIDPMFGTLDEAEKLIAEAHDLGIRIILDVVPPGLLRRDAERAWKMFQDPQTCAVVLVTLPEEMPTTETIELALGAGLAGCSIEDYSGDSIYDLGLARERVAAAAEAAHGGGVHLVLTGKVTSAISKSPVSTWRAMSPLLPVAMTSSSPGIRRFAADRMGGSM